MLLWGDTDNVVLWPRLWASPLLRFGETPGAELTWNEVVDQVLILHLQVVRTARFILLQSPVEITGDSGHLGCHLHGSH